MNRAQTNLPVLDKSDTMLASPEAHARALELACRAAAQIIASRAVVNDAQEPLPESTTRLLRRLASGRG